jgi:hypothetical protein
MKVAAISIFTDKVLDIAILQVAPEAVSHLEPLKLFDGEEPIAYEGERVLAIGSPLNQIRIVTAGIVSKVKRDVIISDVNINHGNSGGPMLNLHGQVIGVNTFLDTDGTGAGIAGSVVITQASKMIEDAIALCQKPDHEPPPFVLYPVMPNDVYPVEELVWSAVSEERDPDFYSITEQTNTGDFKIFFTTPPMEYAMKKGGEAVVAEGRIERELEGSAEGQERYDFFGDVQGWRGSTGQYKPVVNVYFYPETGVTTGSAIANALGAFAAGYGGQTYQGAYQMEYKADFKDAKLYVNDEYYEEITRSMPFIPMPVPEGSSTAVYYGEDMARYGFYQYDPTLFSPSKEGVFPHVVLVVTSIESPDTPVVIVVPQAALERIYVDFEPYYDDLYFREVLKEEE